MNKIRNKFIYLLMIQVTGVIFIPVKGNPVKGRNCTCSCISRLVSVTFMPLDSSGKV